MVELSIFDLLKTPLKIDKPIRLIEMFAGVGSQAKALERLGADFEHYKISEWETNATASYKAVHKGDDNTDYSADFTAEQLTEILYNIGISTDGKKPMSLKEIARKGETWKRTVYNNFKATNNIGSILNVKGEDLGIVDTDKYTYILTYSFPCQDLSLAGKGKGMAKDSGTRSGLLWEVERLLNECTELPQILLMENVTQVHGSKNREHFDEWIRFLESKGYSNFWQDLNSKNFGIPQNRNRTFMVSALGDYTYNFPQEFPLKLRLKDMLEDSVDEKFYLSGKMISGLENFNSRGTGIVSNQGSCFEKKPDVANTLMARDYKGFGNQGMNCVVEPTCEQVGVLSGGKWDKMHDVSRRVYSDDGIAPTLHTCGGGNTEPKVITGIGEKKSNGGTQWYQQDRIYDDKVAVCVTAAANPYYAIHNEAQEPFICASRGRNPENPSDRTAGIQLEQRLEPNFSGCANTLTTVQKYNYVCEPIVCEERKDEGLRFFKGDYVGTLRTIDACGDKRVIESENGSLSGLRIRKLTQKECWRLMGFDDSDFEKAAQVNSNSQLYKQAGNSIVVDVLYYIFREML